MLQIYSKNETNYAVTLDQVKAHLSYDGEDHDDRLELLIAAGSSYLEKQTDRTLTETVYDLYLPRFIRKRIWLPAPPLYQVSYIKYYDTDNELQTLSTSDYVVLAPTWSAGFIEPVECWPETYSRVDGVQIRYTAKWTQTPKVVQAVLLQTIGYLNSDREATQQDFAALQRAIDLIRHEGYPC